MLVLVYVCVYIYIYIFVFLLYYIFTSFQQHVQLDGGNSNIFNMFTPSRGRKKPKPFIDWRIFFWVGWNSTTNQSTIRDSYHFCMIASGDRRDLVQRIEASSDASSVGKSPGSSAGSSVEPKKAKAEIGGKVEIYESLGLVGFIEIYWFRILEWWLIPSYEW